MKKWFPKIIISIIALLVGLIVGLGIGQFQMKKEKKIFQDKMQEASRKIAFIQKKMAEEKNEATASIEQKCQNDLDQLQNEKKALGEQIGKLKELVRKLEADMKQTEEAFTRVQKEFQEERQQHAQSSQQARILAAKKEEELKEQVRKLEGKLRQTEEAFTRTQKELQEERENYAQASRHNRDLENQQKKLTAEKQVLQTELEKTKRNLGQCEVNNAKLCILAEEVVKAYWNKGIGATLMQKEPLTQIRKVELEQLTQAYREEIEKQRIKKK